MAMPGGGGAGRDQAGPVNRGDSPRRADVWGVFGQLIPAAGTMLGDDQKAMREFLQHLRHECRRNTVLLGDLVGATSVLLAMHREMLDSNQPVVGLVGKLEHRSTDFLYSKEYTTNSLAHPS